jgi:HAMP domain-containing protein
VPAGLLSIRTKVIASVLLASLAFLGAAIVLVEGPFQRVLHQILAEEQAKNALRLADDVAHAPNPLATPAEVASRAAAILARRVTIIDATGKVLADTEKDPASLPNHLDREEVREARTSPRGIGSNARSSTSTGRSYLYTAARIVRGNELIGFARIATPLDQIEEVAGRLRRVVLMAAVAATGVALLVGAFGASFATRKLAAMARVADEIGQGELGRRIEFPGRDEVGRLGLAVNLLAERLEEKLVRLTRDRGLLLAVLEAIGEGLAFVDQRDVILAANGSFRRFLGAGVHPEGQRLRDVLHDGALVAAVEKTFSTGRETRVDAVVGDPPRDVRFRIVSTVVANVGTVALLVTEDLSPNPRVESLRVEAAAILARSLGFSNAPLPREAQFALELSRLATLLDERPEPAEVVLLGELLPRARGADEAPALYMVRSRAEAGTRLLRLELGLKDEEPLPATWEVEPVRITLSVEPPARPDWTVPRSSEGLGTKLRALARRLALAHFEAAGASCEEQTRKLVVRLPRA